MRFCCVRSRGVTAGWLEVNLEEYLTRGQESTVSGVDLVELLQQVPEFVGYGTESKGLPRALVQLPDSHSGRVFVAVDEIGRITIVGCPDQSREDGLSIMVGDLLAASGRLWQQPFRRLAEMFGDRDGKNLVERIKSRVENFSLEQWNGNVQRCLKEGKFPVVIVVERYDETVKQTLDYLRQMNLNIRLITFDFLELDGIQVVIPKEGGVEFQRESVRQPATPYLEYTPTVSSPGKDEPKPQRSYEPFPREGTTRQQQVILERLVYLDDLGLIRRGFEYFTSRALERPEAEGTIVVAVDGSRWPFPKPDEVIVVVRTTREHLAGFLKMKQEEIEDFLKQLPREEKKGYRGVLLLYARNVYEANQLVNELKALKEVSQTGVR